MKFGYTNSKTVASDFNFLIYLFHSGTPSSGPVGFPTALVAGVIGGVVLILLVFVVLIVAIVIVKRTCWWSHYNISNKETIFRSNYKLFTTLLTICRFIHMYVHARW